MGVYARDCVQPLASTFGAGELKVGTVTRVALHFLLELLQGVFVDCGGELALTWWFVKWSGEPVRGFDFLVVIKEGTRSSGIRAVYFPDMVGVKLSAQAVTRGP